LNDVQIDQRLKSEVILVDIELFLDQVLNLSPMHFSKLIIPQGCHNGHCLFERFYKHFQLLLNRIGVKILLYPHAILCKLFGFRFDISSINFSELGLEPNLIHILPLVK